MSRAGTFRKFIKDCCSSFIHLYRLEDEDSEEEDVSIRVRKLLGKPGKEKYIFPWDKASKVLSEKVIIFNTYSLGSSGEIGSQYAVLCGSNYCYLAQSIFFIHCLYGIPFEVVRVK